MTRSLARRLERLEEQVIPEDEPKVWQIVITDSDGTKTLGERLNGLRGPVVGKYQRRRNRGGDFAKQRYAMWNLQRRLKKLEALLTDDAGLVPGSPRWLAYWSVRADKILNGDDEVKGCQIPLEVVDAILEARRMPTDNRT